MRQGLLLFGHGARDPIWADPFRAVAARIRSDHPELAVELGFLELMTPDLSTAADALVARGCRAVRVVPLFLGTGGHVRRDLPLLLERLRARHPGIQWDLRPAIGEHPAVIDAIASAASEAIG